MTIPDPVSRQLTLDLKTEPALGRGDFLVAGANRAALAMLDAPDRWPQGRLLLIGPEGAGKTHLAAFWAAERGAVRLPAAALTEARAGDLVCPLVIEDAEAVAGDPGAERALFHLWNLVAQRGGPLLLTARSVPRDWGLRLPDLRSRMDAVAQARLGAPDEALLAAVLVKLFTDRQITVPAGLIDWLVLRMDRDLGLARRLVAALDVAALSDKRAITRRMAADLLVQLTPQDPAGPV